MNININVWVLQGIFLILKMCDIVDWSWVIIFLPLLFPFAVFGIAFLIMLIVGILCISVSMFAILIEYFKSK